MSNYRYYIIEHPRRGTLSEIDGFAQAGARFSWSGLRTDENVQRFPNVNSARRALNHITESVRRECKILAHPIGEETEWKEVK